MKINKTINERITLLKPGIYLRLLTVDDFEIYQAIYSDTEIMKYIAEPFSDEKAKKYFKQVMKAHQNVEPKQLTYAIVNSENDQVMGLVGLDWFDKYDRKKVEVGVMVIPKWRRRKVAHRAKQMIINCAFNTYSAEVVYACCDWANLAANQANQNLGFTEVINTEKKGSQNSRVWRMLK